MKIDEIPDEGPGQSDGLKQEAQQVKAFLYLCTRLLDGGEFTWAYDTIWGIQTTVELTGRVTDGQRRAIRNIQVGGERRRSGEEDREQRKKPSRRYEGWGG